MAAAAHSSSAVSEEVGLTLFLKVGSRGLDEDRKGTGLTLHLNVDSESHASLPG